MITITPTRTMLIDPLDTAELIEALYDHLLAPYEPGYYLPNSRRPVIFTGNQYYRDDRTPYAEGEVFDDAVYDAAGEIIVEKVELPALSKRPTIPYRGICMTRDVAEHIVSTLSRWEINNNYSLRSVLHAHMSETWIATHTTDEIDDAVSTLGAHFMGLREEIRRFVGNDGWIMHFVTTWGRTAIKIEKTVDYRIWDWEHRMRNGEWKNNHPADISLANIQSLMDIKRRDDAGI